MSSLQWIIFDNLFMLKKFVYLHYTISYCWPLSDKGNAFPVPMMSRRSWATYVTEVDDNLLNKVISKLNGKKKKNIENFITQVSASWPPCPLMDYGLLCCPGTCSNCCWFCSSCSKGEWLDEVVACILGDMGFGYFNQSPAPLRSDVISDINGITFATQKGRVT